MSEFHLLRPFWLLALIPLLLLLWWAARRRPEAGNWSRACDPQLLPYLLTGGDPRRSRLPLLLAAIGGVLAVVALAGPVWQQLEQPVFRQSSALVIALDLSRSMDSTDLAPDRITRARHKLLDILERRREGQTALVVYAAQPFAVTPLTDDSRTIAAQVGALATGLMPAQGSRPDLAIQKAKELLDQAGVGSGDLLLITDGIDDGPWIDQLPPGVRISVLGVGTPDGAPVPLPGGGFLKDQAGSIVIPRLDPEALQRLAQRGGGLYRPLSVDDSDVDALLAPLDRLGLSHAEQIKDLQADEWREEGPWLLLLLLPLAALAFRKGVLLSVTLVLLFPLPRPADALDLQGLWLRPDQQAARTLEQGDPAAAAAAFDDPEWKGVAHYQAGEYQQAAEALGHADTTRAHYNRGNALARLGRLEEAIAEYDEVLRRDPADEDAQHNREIVQEQLRRQQQQNQMPPQEQQESGENQESPRDQDAKSNAERPPTQQSQSGDQPKPEPEGDAEQGQTQQPQGKPGEEAPQQGEQPQPDAEQGGQEQPPRPAGEGGEPPEEPPTQQATEPQPEPPQEQQPQDGQPASEAELPPMTEEQRATEQWLRRIPDDPAGLLRRKFQYQYQQQYRGKAETQEW